MTDERHFLSSNSEELIEKIRNHYNSEGTPLSKSQAYKRLDKARIKSYKENGQCWLDAEQFIALEELDKHIKAGGSMNEFRAIILQQEKAMEEDKKQQQLEDREELIAEEILVLDRIAQEKAAGILIAENLITADYLNNWQLLDEDLRAEVTASKKQSFPKKISPKSFAEAALATVRKRRAA